MQIQKFSSMTFREVATAYREDHFADIEPGSVKTYAPALSRAIETFGDRRIDDIQPAEIKRFLKLCGESFARKTVSNQKCVMQQVFDYAIVELSVLVINPCVRVKIPANLQKSQRTPLEPYEVAEIAATRPDEFLLAFLILYTGARCGEALALQMKNIDFSSKKLYIGKAVHFNGNQANIGKLKTKNAERYVPLLYPLEKMLLGLCLAPDDYIIGGAKPITKCALTKRWRRFCINHGLMAWKDGRYVPSINRHQIRHEYATMTFEAGVEPKAVQMLLGHANIQTTLDIYTHFRQREFSKAAGQIEAHFLQMCLAIAG